MKVFFYFLKNMGYSGNNTCIVSRTSNGVVCRCIDRNKRVECDMSQMGGDMYGLACPLFYEPEKGLIEILKKESTIKNSL